MNMMKTQKEYYEKFKLEMQEYERNASRDFFESLVRADFDLEEIYPDERSFES